MNIKKISIIAGGSIAILGALYLKGKNFLQSIKLQVVNFEINKITFSNIAGTVTVNVINPSDTVAVIKTISGTVVYQNKTLFDYLILDLIKIAPRSEQKIKIPVTSSIINILSSASNFINLIKNKEKQSVIISGIVNTKFGTIPFNNSIDISYPNKNAKLAKNAAVNGWFLPTRKYVREKRELNAFSKKASYTILRANDGTFVGMKKMSR